MFDLDQHLGTLNECLDLMRKYRAMSLTGDLARNFISELLAIDDSKKEHLESEFNAATEISEVTESHMYLGIEARYTAIKAELDTSLVSVVEAFIEIELAGMGE